MNAPRRKDRWSPEKRKSAGKPAQRRGGRPDDARKNEAVRAFLEKRPPNFAKLKKTS